MMRSKVLPALFPALVAAALAVHAQAAWGASVKQVRVGDHTDFTRIVVELDGPAAYRVSQKSVGGVAELVVGLDATTATRVVGSRSRLVESVRLRPLPHGAEARIALRAGAVNVKEMVLKNPNRIVLDVSPTKTAAAPPTPAPTPKPTSGTSTTASPPRTAAAPTPTRTTSTAAPTPTTPSPPSTRTALAPTPTKVAATTTPETAKTEPEATPETSPAPSREPLEPGKAEPMTEKAGSPPVAAKKPKALAKKAVGAQPAPMEEPGLIERLAGGDPTLGLSFALGGVAFLLAAFLLLRRRSRRIAHEAAAAPWPPPGAEERPEFAASSASPESGESAHEEEDEGREPLVPMNESNAPLFAATERDDEGDEPVVELPEAPLDAEPEVGAKADSPAVEELERRIERLEARLADSLDARERLERQLAAHTEELRVQRAAIARTQRAVRAAVRGPDAPEQPAAQRVPSQVPSPSADSQPGGGEG
jgi:hypothetical protein